jgi:hypothetical protein
MGEMRNANKILVKKTWREETTDGNIILEWIREMW